MNLCNNSCNKRCCFCYKCNNVCPDFVLDLCHKLENPPYVCNGCDTRRHCKKVKYIYKAKEADLAYKQLLKEARQGVNLRQEELIELRNIIIPAIKKGHSPAMIVMNNPNICRSEATIYRDIDKGLYDSITNLDLPRKVKMKKRVSKIPVEPKPTKNHEGRTYDDYLLYKQYNPYAKIVQYDTVEGIKGEKCLFTIHFPAISFMIAFLIDSQKANNIVSKLDIIKNI